MEGYSNEEVEIGCVQSEVFRSWQHEISVVFGCLSRLFFLVDEQGFEIGFTENLNWDRRHRLEDFHKVIKDFISKVKVIVRINQQESQSFINFRRKHILSSSKFFK